MSGPQFRRANTIHDLRIQTREQSEELVNAKNLLENIENKFQKSNSSPLRKRKTPISPKITRKKSKLIIDQLEQGAPLVRSPGYQHDLDKLVDMLRGHSRFKDPQTLKRLKNLVSSAEELVPTMTEMINVICDQEKVPEIVDYVVRQDPEIWSHQATYALIYDGKTPRPRGLITSYMICDALLEEETRETLLREENIISRLIGVWMQNPIKYNIKKGLKRKIAYKMLKVSLLHLKKVNTDFHQNLQKQISEKELQPDGEPPIVYINIFLRYYVPQFKSQTKFDGSFKVSLCKLIQGYINGTTPTNVSLTDLAFLQDHHKLQKLSAEALKLFTF